MNTKPFAEMDLTPEIRRAVEAMGFENATQIQYESIPLIKEGGDVIGRSQTGTGKTLAFGIPAVELVDVGLRLKGSPQALVLCPTRELAVQAAEEMQKLAAYKPGVRTVCVYGGAPMERQIQQLKTATIVVGTPGRVMDHMRRKTLRLQNVRLMVLDEADEMLSMGFRDDIETILQDTPEERQTVLFSATMPPPILALTKQYQKNPRMVQVAKEQVTVDKIQQTYYEVPMGRKMDALALVLRYFHPTRTIIFCNTKKTVDEVTGYLTAHGFTADGLHGDMKQSQRNQVMASFKGGHTAVLIATDVAARGIDVSDIDYVINYDVPQNPEYYVHRIGRTGRAGKSGCAVTLCSGRRQSAELAAIGRMCKSSIQQKALPSRASVREMERQQGLAQVEKVISELDGSPQPMLEELLGRGHTPEILAAALVRLHFGPEPAAEEELPQSSPRAARVYKKLQINIGRSKNIAPNHIMGAITSCTDLSGREIGKIEIYDDHTLVSVPAEKADRIMADMVGLKINRNPTVTQMAEGASPYEEETARRGRQSGRRSAPARDGARDGARPGFRGNGGRPHKNGAPRPYRKG